MSLLNDMTLCAFPILELISSSTDYKLNIQAELSSTSLTLIWIIEKFLATKNVEKNIMAPPEPKNWFQVLRETFEEHDR